MMMTSVDELLFELGQRKIKLWLDGDRLRYRAAKDALTPDLITQLKNNKSAIIAFLHEANTGVTQDLPSIQPIAAGETRPLSFGQERLWFLYQLEPESTSNNMPVVVRFNGSLDVKALEISIQSVVDRHEVLRSHFPKIKGKPRLVINNDVQIKLPLIDLRELPDEDRDQEALKQTTQEARQPFNLLNGPILRVKLFQLQDDEHLLIWNMHCIACDGASSDVFYQDLTSFYKSLVTNEPLTLEALPVQYGDFAHWQRQWLQGDRLQSLLDYWKKTLKGTIPLLKLPFDHPRPNGVQTYRGDRAPRLLPMSLNEDLNAISQELGGTLFMTLLAAFEVLLYRYSNQEEMLLSFACSGRGQVETERLIGFFTNTLMQRTNLTGNPTFRELFNRVKKDILEAFTHQDIPFEKLIEELHQGQNQGRSPLFQVKFALNPPWSQGRGMSTVNLPNLKIRSLFGYIYHGKTKYDLTLVMREQDDGLGMVFDYNAEMFDVGTMQRMVDHFHTLLEGIVANPDQPIANLPILTASERKTLLEDWNPTPDAPQNLSIIECFEAKVEQTPEAIALATDNQSLTYKALNKKVNQLAHYLQERGVKKQQYVGLCFDRSIATIISILAVLKVEATYIPLSSKISPEQLNQISIDVDISVVLIENKFIGKFNKFPNQTLNWEDIILDLEKYNSENFISHNQIDDLAYILYPNNQNLTSALPLCGIPIQHQNVIQLASENQQLKLSSTDIILQFADISSEIFTFELFSALLNGCTLAIYPASNSIEQLGDFIQTQKISTAWFPTRLFHYLFSQHFDQCSSIRNCLIGGDTFSFFLVQKARRQLPSCQIINTYSLPENTIFASTFLLNSDISNDDQKWMGRPFENTQFYVLDKYFKLLPIGGIGELYLGGSNLAQGYFNQPTKTEAKFIANPFDSNPESRLFKTGYLVRYLPNGNLELLGRINQLVEIKGFKIDLAEVETVLNLSLIVKESVVTLAQNQQGKKYLVAYIVGIEEETLNAGRLRQFLKQNLSDYMIPDVFIKLPSLPLIANGELDRLSLPKADEITADSSDGFVAPQTLLEEQLADIWSKALRGKKVGRHDDFFELGGNSILAVRVFSEIEKVCKTELPLSILFQTPSIYKLAKAIENKGQYNSSSCMVALQPNGIKTPIFCTHAIGTSVQFYRNLSHYMGKDQPFYALQSQFLEQAETNPNLTLEDMAAFYIQEIRSVQSEGPYLLGGYSFGGIVIYEIAQQLLRSGQNVAMLAIFDTTALGGHRRLPRHEQISKHWENFRTLGISYAARKASTQLNFQAFRVQQFIQKCIQTNKNNSDKSAFFRSRLRQIEILHLQALQNYQMQKYPGKVSLFRSAIRPDNIGDQWDEALGWRNFVQESFEIYDLPGNHHDMFKEPNVEVFAEQLNNCIDKSLIPDKTKR
ncbi:MAG: condensation domain-containing protein [Limnothrix sp.]